MGRVDRRRQVELARRRKLVEAAPGIEEAEAVAVAVPVPEAEGESVPETETFALALALGVVILAGIVVAGIVVVAVFVLLDAIGLTLIGSVVVGGIRFRFTVTDALVGSVLVGSVVAGVLSVFGRLDLDGCVDDIVLRRLRALGVGLVRILVLGGLGLRCCVVGFARRRLGDPGALSATGWSFPRPVGVELVPAASPESASVPGASSRTAAPSMAPPSSPLVSSITGAVGSSADDELVCMTEPNPKPAAMTSTPTATPVRRRFLSMP